MNALGNLMQMMHSEKEIKNKVNLWENIFEQ